MTERIAIVGGGISGLAIAWELLSRPRVARGEAEIVVLEGSTRAGGALRSERSGGYLGEWGPHGFLEAPATLSACGRLGLGPRILRARDEAARRFVVRGGRLRELPRAPGGIITSSALSLPGRLRLAIEPWVAASAGDVDETVEAFGRRRFGEEAARILVDAMVTGIWAGDPSRLSLRSAFPEVHAMERAHGSLFRALRAAARARLRGAGAARGHLASFDDGIEELPRALAAAIGPRLRLGATVSAIERRDRGYRLSLSSGEALEAGEVILAIPAWHAAPLVAPLDAELARAAGSIASVSVAVLHLGFQAADAAGLQGFGFLVPRSEGKALLGALVPSNVFPGRAPEGTIFATAMVGGARDPSAIEGDDAALVDRAIREMSRLGAVRGAPIFTRVIRHARAIPQYEVGHAARLASIDDRLRVLPGLRLAGNSYRGVSIGACLAEASRLADAIGGVATG